MHLELDQNSFSISPQLADIPNNAHKRLIDDGMLHYEASIAGQAERYGRGKTTHTIHVWWARRPHSAMRALVFSALSKDLSHNSQDVLKDTTIHKNGKSKALSKARQMLKDQYKSPPRLLDMFGGGGTIPYEASALGAETYSIDSNQLAVFVQRCNLRYSQSIEKKEIYQILKSAGLRIIERLAEDTKSFFPLRPKILPEKNKSTVFGYLWTYSTICKKCGFEFYLSKRRWLSRKKDRRTIFHIQNNTHRQTVEIIEAPNDYETEKVWIGRNGVVRCPKCSHEFSNIDIRNCKDEIIGLVSLSNGKGKEFELVGSYTIPNKKKLRSMEKGLLKELQLSPIKSSIPKWSGIANPSLYGIETHADFLNDRQRLVLLYLIKSLLCEYQNLLIRYDESTTRYVIGLLTSFVDQLVDWNSRLSMWIPQNEQVGRSFCGPGIAMLWDYIETDPVLNGPANLKAKLNRIISGAMSIDKFPILPKIERAFAQSLPFPGNYFDAIVTDPPYYDNLFYNLLADFFYTWKRPVLRKIEPELFKDEQTDDSRELVASKFRAGTAQKAHEKYCKDFAMAIKEAQRVIKDNGIFTIVYSHSSMLGWEVIIKSFRPTSFLITSVQPLSIERKQRPRAMTSEAVNTCITFVAHKSELPKQVSTTQKLLHKLQTILETFAPNLISLGWAENDTALAVFANGVGLIANARLVEDSEDDIKVMELMEATIKKKFSSFRIQKRRSL